MGSREARVWALIADWARGLGEPVSARHACMACADAARGSEVALSVKGTDGREPVYATGQLGERLEELQFILGEGPCVDALASGGPVLAADLSSPGGLRRWPGFAVEAATAGAGGMFAFPLQAGAVRVGVLAMYRAQVGPLSSEEFADALVFADAALVLLLDTRAGIASDALVWPADGMSERRVEVHQATGMISAQSQVGIEQALLRLRAYAFAHNRRIADVAREVVARRLRFAPVSDTTGDS
ncbi:MAG: ANTAR domain-containing protein [Streptosporangiales bacterium]|nr:ANTAR domain-containing protein [Streptosporangiales bacterium]